MKRSITLILILVSLCVYTAFKLLQTWPQANALALLSIPLLLFSMSAWMFLHVSRPQLFNSRWLPQLAWLGVSIMGLWGTYILLAIIVDLAIAVIAALSHFNLLVANYYSKILAYQSTINLSVLLTAGLINGLGFIEVLRGPRVKKIHVRFPELPTALRNLKIAQLSDLHIGLTIRQGYLEKVVGLTNATQPDFIFITGDLNDALPQLLQPYLQPLQNLKARYGVFYVTGNHEYYWGAPALIELVKTLNIIPLLNENRVVDINGCKLLIAGVTDPISTRLLPTHAPNVAQAATMNESVNFKIMLAHRPHVCLEAADLGFDLQLSGHTHAGQFFPFSLLMPLAHKYYRGLNQHNNLQLYVNPGTGYWGPANRFGIPAEISLLQLLPA